MCFVGIEIHFTNCASVWVNIKYNNERKERKKEIKISFALTAILSLSKYIKYKGTTGDDSVDRV